MQWWIPQGGRGEAVSGDAVKVDVLVIGGGNAALCAALMAREAGASVLLLEAAPREWRGGNSMHTRNLRCMHDAPQDVLVEAYPEEEYWQDLLKVTGGLTDEKLARLVIRASQHLPRPGCAATACTSSLPCPARCTWRAPTPSSWAAARRWSMRTTAAPSKLGVQIRYNAPVSGSSSKTAVSWPPTPASTSRRAHRHERIEARACVLAAGGFESNIDWLREAWGQNERGEWPADNFLIRGTRFNQGMLLQPPAASAGADAHRRPDAGAHGGHRRARAAVRRRHLHPHRLRVAGRRGQPRSAERFYDEGEDFWPKRYAIWGRLVAQQPGQIGYSIIDAKAIGRFMPPVFPGVKADTWPNWRASWAWTRPPSCRPLDDYNAACRVGTFDHAALDDCHTEGLTPAKTHWARAIDTPPFYGYALKPGITFTYLGLKIDETAAVRFGGKPSRNLFVAGEMMAGNVLGKGYTAGVGMSIGTAFGRIAGTQAARAAAPGSAHAAA